jgi:hypothetical protein
MSKLRAKTLKSQLTKQYNLRPGKRFNYKDEGVDKLYEVQKLYPNCILLKDVFDGTKFCPGYNKLLLMLGGIE